MTTHKHLSLRIGLTQHAVKIEGIEKGQVFILTEAIEYTVHVINTRTILSRYSTGVTIPSPGTVHTATARISSSFDIYIQMLEGHADVMIDLRLVPLEIGQGTVIPADTSNVIVARMSGKVLARIMPSGHEDEWFI